MRARIVAIDKRIERWPVWFCREIPFCPAWVASIREGVICDEDVLAIQG